MRSHSAPARLLSLGHRASARVRAHRRARAFEAGLSPRHVADLQQIGDLAYGGYLLPADSLSASSTCYLAGTGTDISFDLLVIARFGCEVHAFDPVPAAADYVRGAAAHEPRLHFSPVALWRTDEELAFHAPRTEGFVSHSAVDMHGTPVAFRAQGRSVASLMRERGHAQLDLLKISAEGSEHAIIEGALADGIHPRVLCVEFAQPAPVSNAEHTMRRVEAAGYDLAGASIEPWNWKLTWLWRGGGPEFSATPPLVTTDAIGPDASYDT